MSERRRIVSVSELNLEARRVLEQGLGELWVSGELSRVTLHTSGHWYFTLKDPQAAVSCAMFARENASVDFVPEEGMKVELLGRASLYEASGRYQLIVSEMEASGRGDLQKQFEALKAKLAAEGLFDEMRKKPLPKVPQRIGLVTSSTGAAVRDLVEVLTRRFPHLEILLAPVPVQGEGSARRIAAAIEYLNQRQELDLLIVGRGGGSLEDLWAFNEEVVARAITASELPVISAVGHEIDFTIADFVADVRAPTPSAAAELAVPEEADLTRMLGAEQRRLVAALRDMMQRLQIRFERLADHPVFREPAQAVKLYRQDVKQLKRQLAVVLVEAQRARAERVSQAGLRGGHTLERSLQQMQQRVDEAGLRLRHGCDVQRRDRRRRMEHVERQLVLLNPLAVLSRGYSLTMRGDGSVMRSVAEAKVGEAITTQLEDGQMISSVKEFKNRAGEEDG
ncbi:MAG: exodeoxyribonuclease VII large subunit [Kiritimatiellaceae bacterium]|nr:exodeoxyribonuclease VII large subunit [Kiritimatiellaceae bacterium]